MGPAAYKGNYDEGVTLAFALTLQDGTRQAHLCIPMHPSRADHL